MNTWFEIKAQADTAGPVEAFIYDEIGIRGTTAKDFISAVQPFKDREITLRINSPGGSVWDGLAIYNYLRGLNVTTRVDGIAASMASVVALAGKRVEIASNGFFMVHNPSGVAIGDAKDIESYLDMMTKMESTLAGIYQRETGASADQVKEWLKSDTWFTADEAKSAGLVDAVTEGIALSAKAEWNRKPPTKSTGAVDSPQKAMATATTDKTLLDTLKALLGITPAPAELNPQPEAKVDTELTQARADLATAKTTIGTIENRVKVLEGENATLKTAAETAKAEAEKAIKDAKAELDKQASVKAAAITASQGQPPLDVKPTDKPATAGSNPQNWTEKALAAKAARAK